MSNVTLTAYSPASGEIRYNVTGPSDFLVIDADPDIEWVDGQWSDQTHYVVNEAPTARPATGLPATHTLATGFDWAVSDVPEGTEVLVDGEMAGTVDATGLVLNFGLAGVWRVDLRPPFPWLAASCEVTVT